MQPFGRNRYGPKIGGLRPFQGEGAGSPSNTLWPGLRPTCMPSFILIRPTVWPHCTNVTDRTDRTDRQRTDSIGRTVLQAVAQLSSLFYAILWATIVHSAVHTYILNRPNSSLDWFCLTGPISPCLDSMCYFACYCILHACVVL